MKPGLAVGAQCEFTLVVTDEMKAQFNGTVVHNLYATASMITHMEWACRQHILPYLEPDEEGVGSHIDVRHRRPTQIGETVRVQATVSAIEPTKVICHVQAWNLSKTPEKPLYEELIGEGFITQGLVCRSKLLATNPLN